MSVRMRLASLLRSFARMDWCQAYLMVEFGGTLEKLENL